MCFQDNYKMYQETKPKKLRKKVKPSAMIRPQKRNKKRKKPLPKTLGIETCSIVNNTVILSKSHRNMLKKTKLPVHLYNCCIIACVSLSILLLTYNISLTMLTFCYD